MGDLLVVGERGEAGGVRGRWGGAAGSGVEVGVAVGVEGEVGGEVGVEGEVGVGVGVEVEVEVGALGGLGEGQGGRRQDGHQEEPDGGTGGSRDHFVTATVKYSIARKRSPTRRFVSCCSSNSARERCAKRYPTPAT